MSARASAIGQGSPKPDNVPDGIKNLNRFSLLRVKYYRINRVEPAPKDQEFQQEIGLVIARFRLHQPGPRKKARWRIEV